MHRSFARTIILFAGLPLASITACGTAPPISPLPGEDVPTTTEKILDVRLSISGKILRIAVRDGDLPVSTDAWIYTLKGGAMTPLTGFQDPVSKRRYRGLMMPCSLAGDPSHLVPCDDGARNGVMTDAVREKIVGGVRSSAIDGAVDVTLDEAPVDPIVVVVGREDERYAGAGAINPDGQKAAVPIGAIAKGERPVVTYSADVAPILNARCVKCHGPGGKASSLMLDSYNSIVNRDFGFAEAKDRCDTTFAADAAQHEACVHGITQVEYFVEPGNPALSPLLWRTRPDEQKSVSPVGLAWYGSKGSRFGSKGDRRMPPSNTTMDPADDMPVATYFDDHPEDYQILFDWVAQGAAE